MKIGVDAQPLIGPRTGVGNYVLGILRALDQVAEEDEFALYTPRPLGVAFAGSRLRVRVHRGVKGTNGPLWLHLHARRMAERDRVDVYWGTNFVLPIGLSHRIPAVVTVYDLVAFFFPHTMEFRNLVKLRLLMRASLKRARHVATISEAVRRDLHRAFGVALDRISVVPPGVGTQFRLQQGGAQSPTPTSGLDGPYLLAVGTIEPRKNLPTLIRAYSALPAPFRRRYPLAVVGAAGWKNAAIHALAEPLVREGAVRFLGYVPEDELPGLYRGAMMLLFPSWYEGFGMPVIEAMACGTPVVASDIPVLRETGGDAAMFVAPADVPRWTEAIATLAADPLTRQELRERGLQRAAAFSFEESARRLLAVWKRCG